MLLNVTNNTIYPSYFFCDKYHDNNKLVREPVYFIISPQRDAMERTQGKYLEARNEVEKH